MIYKNSPNWKVQLGMIYCKAYVDHHSIYPDPRFTYTAHLSECHALLCVLASVNFGRFRISFHSHIWIPKIALRQALWIMNHDPLKLYQTSNMQHLYVYPQGTSQKLIWLCMKIGHKKLKCHGFFIILSILKLLYLLCSGPIFKDTRAQKNTFVAIFPVTFGSPLRWPATWLPQAMGVPKKWMENAAYFMENPKKSHGWKLVVPPMTQESSISWVESEYLEDLEYPTSRGAIGDVCGQKIHRVQVSKSVLFSRISLLGPSRKYKCRNKCVWKFTTPGLAEWLVPFYHMLPSNQPSHAQLCNFESFFGWSCIVPVADLCLMIFCESVAPPPKRWPYSFEGWDPHWSLFRENEVLNKPWASKSVDTVCLDLAGTHGKSGLLPTAQLQGGKLGK